MAVNPQNFIIPESDFSGAYRASDSLQKVAARKDDQKKQLQTQKATSAAFLQNYLDPKDALTGTPYDPMIVQGFDDLKQQGLKLAMEDGLDQNMLMMALAPSVAKLNQYSVKAKEVNARLKDQLALIPANAGYDKAKLEQLSRKQAFYDEGGQIKDITTVDPSVDWITETIKSQPDEVTSDISIDKFVKDSKMFTNVNKVKRINPKGGYETKNVEVNAPAWATVDDEGKVVPLYEIATDNGKPQMFNFKGKDGKEEMIRLLEKKQYNSMISGSPEIRDWLRGQIKAAGYGTDLSKPEAENAARAIMYSELKRRMPGGMKDIEEIKKDPAPKISINNYNSNKKTPSPIDLREYPDAGNGFKDITTLVQGVKVTGLPDGKTLLAETVKYNPQTQKVTFKEFAERGANGKIITGGKEKTVSLTKFLQDIKTNNPNTDMDFLEGLRSSITGAAPQQNSGGLGSIAGSAKQNKYEIKGKVYTESELLKMGYTADQIKPYKKK